MQKKRRFTFNLGRALQLPEPTCCICGRTDIGWNLEIEQAQINGGFVYHGENTYFMMFWFCREHQPVLFVRKNEAGEMQALDAEFWKTAHINSTPWLSKHRKI